MGSLAPAQVQFCSIGMAEFRANYSRFWEQQICLFDDERSAIRANSWGDEAKKSVAFFIRCTVLPTVLQNR